jgi:hypothetical protein
VVGEGRHLIAALVGLEAEAQEVAALALCTVRGGGGGGNSGACLDGVRVRRVG